MDQQDALKKDGVEMHECTGPYCGRKPQGQREKVKTAGTYCSACGQALQSEARGRQFPNS